MDGMTRERGWVDQVISGVKVGYLRLFGLEGSRIESRKAVVVLTLVCTVGVVLARSFKIPLLFPWLWVDFSAIFLFLPLLVCPWAASLAVWAGAVALSVNKLAGGIGVGVSVQFAYFLSRYLEKRGLGRYRLLAVIPATFAGTFVGGGIMYSMLGLVPFQVGASLAALKSCFGIVLVFGGVPIVWHFLRKSGLL
ncbi:hypothetical protein ES703_59388 [subsurface metagenome]